MCLEQVQVANNQQTYIRVANCQTVRMKEEKEVLEHFAGVFTMMNPLTFKEIFQTTVPYMVERISKNYALQVLLSDVLASLQILDLLCLVTLLVFVTSPRLWQILSWPTFQHLPYLPPSLWSIFWSGCQKWDLMLSFQIFT